MWTLWFVAGAVLAGTRAASAQRMSREAYATVDSITVLKTLASSRAKHVGSGRHRALHNPYLLADAGYDVWLGNLRGTAYSSHPNLTTADPQYWQFSFEEHGALDLPAMIDKVLAVSRQPRLLYVGYSMGTTSFFVMASERPDYVDRVVAFVALAPAVYLDNLRATVDLLIYDAGWTESLRARGVHAVSLRREVRALLVGEGGVCRARRPQDDACMWLVYGVVGEDYAQNDWDAMPLVLARFQPAGLRQLEHFAKVARTGEFVSWGGGMEDESARRYNISNLRLPVHLFYGENDMLTFKPGVLRLAASVGNAAVTHPVRWHKFNHLDFMFARNLDRLLTKEVVRLIGKLYADDEDQNNIYAKNSESRPRDDYATAGDDSYDNWSNNENSHSPWARYDRSANSWTRDKSSISSWTQNNSLANSRTQHNSPANSRTQNNSPANSWTQNNSPANSWTQNNSSNNKSRAASSYGNHSSQGKSNYVPHENYKWRATSFLSNIMSNGQKWHKLLETFDSTQH